MFILSCFGPESGALRVCLCVCLCTFLLVFCIVCSPWQRWLKGGQSIIIAAARERKKRKESWGNCASGARWPNGDRIMAIWLFFLFFFFFLQWFCHDFSCPHHIHKWRGVYIENVNTAQEVGNALYLRRSLDASLSLTPGFCRSTFCCKPTKHLLPMFIAKVCKAHT